jgi:hypothetical protein
LRPCVDDEGQVGRELMGVEWQMSGKRGVRHA